MNPATKTLVANAKRSLIERINHAYATLDEPVPSLEWAFDSPHDLMPTLRVNGRRIRFGVAVGQEPPERSPWTPYPVGEASWSIVMDWLLFGAGEMEERE